jgi:hypothetical protein
LFVVVISRAWTKSGFYCLWWLFPEPEQRVCFVVCFGYIQSLTKSGFCCLLWLFPVWAKSVFCCLLWLYPVWAKSVFVVCCSYIQSLNEEVRFWI